MAKSAWTMRKENAIQPSTLQLLDMPNVRKASHHKGMRECLEAQHAAKKMHSNSFQIHDLWGTAMDSILFVKFMKG